MCMALHCNESMCQFSALIVIPVLRRFWYDGKTGWSIGRSARVQSEFKSVNSTPTSLSLYFAIRHFYMQGKSYSIGLDENATTIAAFLRFYTPGIIGGSLGNHIGEVSVKTP